MRISKKPEERKLEIAEAALELFREKGYENVSVKDITTKVNVAAGLFHYYFHSKEEVLMECVRLDRQKFIDDINAPGYFPDGMDAVDKINFLMRTTLDSLAKNTQLIKESWNINSAMLMNKVKDFILSGFSDKLTDVIAQGNREGIFSCEYPQATAEIAVYGLAYHYLKKQERDPELRSVLLGEYIYAERAKIRGIMGQLLGMKDPSRLLRFNEDEKVGG